MKKKQAVTSKDKKDWSIFTKEMDNITDKESHFLKREIQNKKIRKLDLHGYSLDEANLKVKNFIIESFNNHYTKLLIVTGKGLRSKSPNNPYVSEKLSVLKYSVPEFIKNDKNLSEKIHNVSNASLRDGGEGAIYIFLKKKENL